METKKAATLSPRDSCFPRNATLLNEILNLGIYPPLSLIWSSLTAFLSSIRSLPAFCRVSLGQRPKENEKQN